MTVQVIGCGVGRTGTFSLKLALNQLGVGPCHHMEAVVKNKSEQVPLWSEALKGNADWPAIYDGFSSAVDWPTAAFFRELSAAYPSAKFVLTVRSPESWVESFSATIYQLISKREKAPDDMQAWMDMCIGVIGKSGIPLGLEKAGLREAFIAHNEAVQAAIPQDRLLTFQVKEGWQPLCDFLGVPAPSDPFPRTNDREEFWDLVAGKT